MIILDCEASGLSQESYPIQIAWLNVKTGESDSFYIKPSERWNYWNFDAEAIHNIKREFLFDAGLDVEDAAERLYQAIGKEKVIYSDAPDYEQFWVDRLMEEAARFTYAIEFEHCIQMIDDDPEAMYRFNTLLLDQAVSDMRTHDALDDCHAIAKAFREATSKY